MDDPERASRGGWVFDEPGGDPVFGRRDLRQGQGEAASSDQGQLRGQVLVLCIACSTEQQAHPALPTPLQRNVAAHFSLPPSQPCRQVYDLLSPGFTGRCTAPLLVDKRARRAVCNESAIICSNFAELARPLDGAPAAVELRPPQLAGEIERWNERIYETGECWK